MRFFLIFLSLMINSIANSATTDGAKDPRTAAASAKRLYPGGRDEDDLKVQENLPVPTARIDRKQLDSKVIKNTNGKSDEDDDAQVEE